MVRYVTKQQIMEGGARAFFDRKQWAEGEPQDRFCDEVAVAHQWFDAQDKTKICSGVDQSLRLAEIIGGWAGMSVSRRAVEIAANMHPDIKRSHQDFYNLPRTGYVVPDIHRLEGVERAGERIRRRLLDDPAYNTETPVLQSEHIFFDWEDYRFLENGGCRSKQNPTEFSYALIRHFAPWEVILHNVLVSARSDAA